MAVTRLIKGLNKDTSLFEQQQGSYLFALNSILGTELGDENFLSNENSNALVASLKEGYIPIGSIYIDKNRTVVFSVSKDDSISEIGILYSNDTYVSIMNDKDCYDNLKFSINNPIRGFYRLVGGCNETIYWTDGNTKPKQFNISRVENYQNSSGYWAASKFNLQKTCDKLPEYKNIEVLDFGGNITPGSYSFVIQYLDQSWNPTEWMADSSPVRIYNDNTTKEFREVSGSINSEIEYLKFPNTSKAIKISLSNLDSSYSYYRIGIIVCNSSLGTVNDILYSDTIPTTKDSFIFTGDNFASKGTLEDVKSFNRIFEKVKTMAQMDNKLILGGIKEIDASLCELQKYASKIKVDCITKEIVLNDIKDPNNPKNPIHCFNNGIGYMPGEIYSLGITYLFDDMSLSPVYHIPGLNTMDSDTTFTEGDNVYPMATDNQIDTVYTSNNSCSSNDYWGVDYNGEPLVGKQVRHHRFPLRSELGIPLVKTEYGEEFKTKNYFLKFGLKGKLKLPVPCPDGDPDCGTDKVNSFTLKVEYKVGSESFFSTEVINPNSYADYQQSEVDIEIVFNTRYHNINNFLDIKILVADENGIFKPLSKTNMSLYYNGTVTEIKNVDSIESTVQGKIVKTDILGLKFSGIERPSSAVTNGKKVVGFYIVRNERTEFDKSILDSAVLFPSIENNKYVSHGILQPQTESISKDTYGMLHLENKFSNKEYLEYDQMIQEGNFKVVDRKFGKVNYDDVYDGSSYNSKSHKDGNDDGQDVDGSPTSRGFDGWSLNIITRDNIVEFESQNKFVLNSTEIKDRFYLNALESKPIDDYKKDYYNIAGDNNIGVIQTKSLNKIKGNLPYVILKKKNLDSYSNFRYLPYYKESNNPVYFGEEETVITSVFNGDSYVAPLRYTNTVYWDNRVADRAGKSSILKIIIGALVLIAGAVLAATGIGAGAGALVIGSGISIFGAGALFAASGLKIENFNKAYAEEYQKGLRQTALDSFTDMFYNYKDNIPFGYEGNGKTGYSGPSDDTIQWASDCITDLWFESTINTNLRNGFVRNETPTFLSAPGRIESGNDSKIGTWEFFGKYYTNSNSQRYPISTLEQHISRKLLAFDDARDDNRYYIGAPLGEYYNINPDYKDKGFIKPLFHLPAEYDCCSDCLEEYPHRLFYSESSYQEEQVDNYRVFRPNNYKDIDGESGVITDMFTIGENLFVHTTGTIWHLPKQYQERITDQIVSFLGTGEFLSLPARRVVDAHINLGGCSHTLATIKTPTGVYFCSVGENKIFRFDGKQLQPISDLGLRHWFNANMSVQAEDTFYNNHLEEYPFSNKPSSPFGTGFISAYDTENNRIIFSKKDITIKNLPEKDFKLSTYNGKLVIFKNFSSLEAELAMNKWVFDSIQGNKLIFKRVVYLPIEDTRYVKGVSTSIPSWTLKHEIKEVVGETINRIETIDNSWTLSFSLMTNTWTSFHSYLPHLFINSNNRFYSMIDNNFWKHNIKGSYQNFYGIEKPYIVEYASNTNPTNNVITDFITVLSRAFKYSKDHEEYVEVPDITFNQALFYNSRQCTGLIDLKVKNENEEYLIEQTQNSSVNEIFIDRTEDDWNINQIRDLRVDYTQPIFKSNIEDLQDGYFIDKVLNENTLDYFKDWSEQESLKGKYLVVRLIFNNFEDVKLLLNYSIEDEKQSFK